MNETEIEREIKKPIEMVPSIKLSKHESDQRSFSWTEGEGEKSTSMKFTEEKSIPNY